MPRLMAKLLLACAYASAMMPQRRWQHFAPRGSRLLASTAAGRLLATAAAKRSGATALTAAPRKTAPLGVRGGARGWTAATAATSLALFVSAAVLEIGGGWLVWRTLREGARARSSVAGALALAAYGFVMTLQPAAAGEAFGRLDAAYGGVFVAMSFVWGRFVEGVRLDTGDRIGAALCLAGVAVIMGWRRD